MNQKDSPCANVVVTAQLVSCLADAKASADIELNSIYASVRVKLTKGNADRLLAAQRLWVGYRDANCQAERGLYEGGTAAPPAYVACVEAMTRARVKELQVMYVVALK